MDQKNPNLLVYLIQLIKNTQNYQINPLMEIVKKKVIKVDESLKSEILNFEDDDVKNTKKNNRRSMVENSLNLASIVKNNPCRRTQSFCGNSTYKNKRSRSRPRRKLFIDTHFSALTDTSSSPISTPEAESLPGSPNFDSGSFDFDDSIECSLNTSQMHASLQSEFLSSEQWETALQTLHLSFEEVVHIRSVLTKAEMEGLPLDGTFKEDVEKGKVCFLCMRTRFGIFTWSHKCQMCQQFVCNKCSSKMNIPLEHFSYSPHSSNSSSSRKNNTTNNNKASPGGCSSDEEYEYSKSSSSLTSSILRANQLKKHSKLLICTDCREMVLQVIRTQQTARRVEMSKSFYLNLSPNYSGKEELY
nr:protein spire homolog 1-like isoform X2 [Lepeophtheirus salmonis]